MERALLFGSFVDVKFDEYSDIDLLLIGKVKRTDLSKKISKLEKQIGREINYTIYSKTEFNKKQDHDPFLKNIFSNKFIDLL